jgi:hypothetical protein
MRVAKVLDKILFPLECERGKKIYSCDYLIVFNKIISVNGVNKSVS